MRAWLVLPFATGQDGAVTRGLLDRTSAAVRDSTTASVLARAGLAARAGFYVLLAYLAARIAFAQHGQQANAGGALRTVSATPLGRLPVALAAAGFLVLGVSRLLGAIRDRRAGWTSRIPTGLQGLFYVALTEVPASFALGNRTTGSDQQERTTTGRLLMLPGGRVLVVAAGVVFVAVCCWQLVTAARAGFTSSMRTEGSPSWVRLLVRVTGKVGIISRALVFLPLGIFLVLAGLWVEPRRAKGLNASLSELAAQPWGRGALVVIAAGFVVFALYTVLEARYRDVDAGH